MARWRRISMFLRQFIKNPRLLAQLIDEDSEMQAAMQLKYQRIALPTVSLLSLFPDFDVKINNYTYLHGTSLPTDLALLKRLAQQIGSECSYLEIGTWRGESILNVASIAKNCVSISLSIEEMRKIGLSEKETAQNALFCQHLPNVQRIEHNSLTFDFGTLKQSFDLVFIDGEHSYEAVKKDTENCFALLKNEQSVIVWHDYAHDTEQVRSTVLMAIFDALPASEHQYLYHVANTMSAIYTRQPLLVLTDNALPHTPIFEIQLKAQPFSAI